MKTLISAKEWWLKQRYQFYRPEYEKLQNKLLNFMPVPLVIILALIAILAIMQKYLTLSIDYILWIQALAILLLCCVLSLFASSMTLRWVDEHEKKLHSKTKVK